MFIFNRRKMSKCIFLLQIYSFSLFFLSNIFKYVRSWNQIHLPSKNKRTNRSVSRDTLLPVFIVK